MRLFGLGGYAESGKDAFADLLLTCGSFGKTYMSKPLEQALLTLDPWMSLVIPEFVDRFGPWVRYRDLHAAVGYTESKREPEVRGVLQRLGTDVGRNMFGQNVWVEAMLKDAASLDGNVLVTGIRFPNEIDTVRANGVTVWVDRGTAPVNAHVSDNTLGPDDFDVVVDNTGTLDDLALAAREFQLFVVHNLPIAETGCTYLRFNSPHLVALRPA